MLQMADQIAAADSVACTVREYRAGSFASRQTPAIREIPLAIELNGREVVTLLCTGKQPRELALGFLKSDAWLRDPGQVLDAEVDQEPERITVRVRAAGDPWKGRSLHRCLTSGCGKGTNFERNLATISRRRIDAGLSLAPADILRLGRELRARSTLHAATRGCHNASLCTPAEMLLFREDIGRHNAIDMLVGRCFEQRIPTHDKLVVATGRVASEILLKVARIGAPVLAATGRATSLSVELARRIGMTLVAAVREDAFWIYNDPGRIREE